MLTTAQQRSSYLTSLWSLLLAACLLCAALPGAADDNGAEIVLRSDDPVSIVPGLHMLLPPLSETASVDDVLAGKYDASFSSDRSLLYPEPHRYYWYYFDLRTQLYEKRELVLNFNDVLFDSIELYYRGQEGWMDVSTGALLPYSKRPLKYPFLALPFESDADQVQRYYIRLKTSSFPVMDFRVSTATGFAEAASGARTLNTLIIGLLGGLIFYMLQYVRLVRPNADLALYLLFVASGLMVYSYISGFNFGLSKDVPGLVFAVFFYSIVVHHTALSLFTLRFIARQHASPGWLRPMVAAPLLAIIVLAALAPFIGIRELSNSLIYVAALNFLPVFAAFLYFSLQGVRAARVICFGIFLNLLAVASSKLVFLADSSLVGWTCHSYVISLLLQSMLVSLVVRDRVRGFRRDAEELRENTRLAEKTALAKGNFLSKVSHELRTPVNGVLGMAQMLEVSGLNETQKRYADIIVHSGKTLLNIINDVLDFSKIERGEFTIRKEAFDLDELLCRNAAIFRNEFARKGLRFDYRMSADCPYAVIGDALRLQQVLNKLCTNALKFTHHGGATLAITVSRRAYEEVVLEFVVSDSGIGIGEDHQNYLFEPFANQRSDAHMEFGGSGLGLVISRQLVELMGGKLVVDSELDEGTMVSFSIPLQVDEVIESRRLSLYPGMHGKRVKLVMGSHTTNEMLSGVLSSWGCEVDVHPLGEDKLQSLLTLEDGCYDLMIISGNLVNRFSERKREMLCHRELPILILESHDLFGLTGIRGRFENVETLMMPSNFTRFRQEVAIVLGLEKVSKVSVEKTFVNLKHDVSDLRVLVAEDNPINRQVIGAMLKQLLNHIDMVENGQQCIDYYMQNFQDIDLILMDCEMPIVNGYKAAHDIRRFELANNIYARPIIALTAHVLPEQQQKCFESGMDKVLAKPLKMEELAEALAKFAVANRRAG